VNVDLGYMPSAPVALKVYDLKGKVVATEQVNTRFANVRIEAVSGVYLFRAVASNALSPRNFYIAHICLSLR